MLDHAGFSEPMQNFLPFESTGSGPADRFSLSVNALTSLDSARKAVNSLCLPRSHSVRFDRLFDEIAYWMALSDDQIKKKVLDKIRSGECSLISDIVEDLEISRPLAVSIVDELETSGKVCIVRRTVMGSDRPQFLIKPIEAKDEVCTSRLFDLVTPNLSYSEAAWEA